MTNADRSAPAPDGDRAGTEARWQARPVVSLLMRAFAVLLPGLAGAGTAVAIFHAAPQPTGLRVLGFWLALVVVCTLVALLVERGARRLLPLATLLELTLVFPDKAPSRFALVRGAANARVLEERIRRAKLRGVDDDPSRAAGEILSLVAALSAHDKKTRGHSERVRAFADMVATELRLSPADRDRLRWAALLHDVGKLRVPPRILNKPGKPDAQEWETLKQHPEHGAKIAAPLLPWLGEWGLAIAQHHERFDGGGYPRGLGREELGLGARIVSVADSFEVMTAARAYKKPMSVPAARRELARCAGGQFDPTLVRAFLNISIGRLWWTVGPASWIAITPMLGWLSRTGAQVAITAKTAAVVATLGLSGAINGPWANVARAASAQPTADAAYAPGGDAAGRAPHRPGPRPAAHESAQPDQPDTARPDHDDGANGADEGEEAPRPADTSGSGGSDTGSSAGGPGGGGPGGGGTGGGGTGGGDPAGGVTDQVDDVIDGVGGTVGSTAGSVGETVDGVSDTASEAVDDVSDAVNNVADDLPDLPGPSGLP
jgi:putative nucleotidyltransferase with HDIG domain